MLRALDHPNVVRVFEAGVTEGYSYLAMELVEGLDLRAYLSPLAGSPILELSSTHGTSPALEGVGGLVFDMEAWLREPETHADVEAIVARPPGRRRRRHPRPRRPHGGAGDRRRIRLVERGADPPHAVDLAAGEEPEPEPPSAALALHLNRPERLARLRAVIGEVLGALDYVHGRGLVHRDLKPSNIMVDDERRARIMDFGLVKQLADASALTRSGRVVGHLPLHVAGAGPGATWTTAPTSTASASSSTSCWSGAPPFPSSVPAELWHEIPPSSRRHPGDEPGRRPAPRARRCRSGSSRRTRRRASRAAAEGLRGVVGRSRSLGNAPGPSEACRGEVRDRTVDRFS